jgi:hypothetical protein
MQNFQHKGFDVIFKPSIFIYEISHGNFKISGVYSPTYEREYDIIKKVKKYIDELLNITNSREVVLFIENWHLDFHDSEIDITASANVIDFYVNKKIAETLSSN